MWRCLEEEEIGNPKKAKLSSPSDACIIQLWMPVITGIVSLVNKQPGPFHSTKLESQIAILTEYEIIG